MITHSEYSDQYVEGLEKKVTALEAELAEAIKAIERLQALKWDEFNGVAKEADK